MIAIFLGAGFSAAAGLPLARGLFDEEPQVDAVSRQRLVDRVLARWHAWESRNRGFPEEYLASLRDSGGRDWLDAVWYVALVIALRTAQVEFVGGKPKVTRHNLDRTSGVPAHESFWSAVFRQTQSVAVITTNYDILAERGLRVRPRPHVPRPGFHYGAGTEALAGGGYPSYTHIRKISASGAVPLLKLHGSVSWSYRGGKLVRYHDCRPAVRGDAAIIPPVTGKRIPAFLQPIWTLAADVLAASRQWLFVGYSLPDYDHLVRELLVRAATKSPDIHVFDPSPSVVRHYEAALGLPVHSHPGIPEGTTCLPRLLG